MVGTHVINLNGLVCPLPVAKTKRKLLELEEGELLEIMGDFVESGENIKRYVESKGHEVLEFEVKDSKYRIKVKKS